MLAVVTVLLGSSSAFACACCVEAGYYEFTRAKPDAYFLGILGDLDLDGPAQLYMSVAGFDGIKGLDDLAKDDAAGKDVGLDVSESFAGRTWNLNVKTASGRSGTLVLPMPAVFTRYKADLHDAPDTGLGVGLYKEIVLKGTVSRGTGIFRSANAKPTSYSLVFQGRGNGCDSSSDYTHWRLELDGRSAEYAFFGKVKA